MLVYASEASEAPVESEIDSEYDTLVQQNTEIIQQNTAIIEDLEKLDTTCVMIFIAILLAISWKFGTYIVHSLFGSS